MKVIHINFSFTTGGIDTMLVDIINQQIKSCEVELLIINDLINYELIKMIDDNVKIHLIKRPRGSKNPYYILKLNLCIFKSHPDYIHCHNNKLADVLFVNIKKGLTFHALDLPISNLYKFNQLFSISQAVKDDIQKRGGYDSTVIYNGINYNVLHKSENCIRQNPFKIVQVSRLDHTAKGQHILIKALDIIINRLKVKDIVVDFIGEGSSLNYLLELTKEFHLTDNVNFLGNKNRIYIYENLPKYNLLVQPSINEGFGLTILEGIGSNIPVLASNSNGLAEISKKLNYDFLFETGNVEQLSNAILNVYKKNSDKNYFNSLEIYNKRAQELFSIEQTARNYLLAYKTINNK